MSGQPFIVWKDDYNTGIDILDKQYRCLGNIINNYFTHRDEVSQNIYKNIVPTMKMFIVSVKVNFFTIEKLLKISEYDKIENQMHIHAEKLANIIVNESKYIHARDGWGMIQYLRKYWIATVDNKNEEYIVHLIRYFVWRKKS